MDMFGYEMAGILINLIHTYVMLSILRILNHDSKRSYLYQKGIERSVFVGWTGMQFALAKATQLPYIILLSNFLILFGITFQYQSRIKVKFLSAAMALVSTTLPEMAAGLFLFSSYPPMMVPGKDTLSLFFDSRILDLTTLSFFLPLESKEEAAKRGKIHGYLPVMLAFSALLITIHLSMGVLPDRHMMFHFLLLAYLLIAFGCLYARKRQRTEEERKEMQRKMEHYRRQHSSYLQSLKGASGKRDSKPAYFWVIGDLAVSKEEKRLLAYADHFTSYENRERIIRTGHETIDSILNVEYRRAKGLGMQIKPDISLPPNLEADDVDITAVVSGILTSAIEEIQWEQDRSLHVKMRVEERNRLHISMNHRVAEEEGKRYQSIYQKKAALRGVQRAAERYSGSVEVSLTENRVFVSVKMRLRCC